MSNKKLSILFTGQGSQNPEMGSDLANKFDWIKNRYEISSDILGYDVFKAQRNPKLINLTEYSQPMIFIFSSILIDIYRPNLSKTLLILHWQDTLWENIVPFILQKHLILRKC